MTPAREFELQRALPSDAEEIAELYLAARADALPYLRRVHADSEVRAWIAEVIVTDRETWICRRAGRIIGFMALDGEDLDQLYLAPGRYRQGLGSCFVAKAKARSPRRLHLYTFQRNRRARAFYEVHGFQAVNMNDGSRNEEGEPDIFYEWVADLGSVQGGDAEGIGMSEDGAGPGCQGQRDPPPADLA